jgi:hypothetical protein
MRDLPTADALMSVAEVLSGAGLNSSALRTLELATQAGATGDDAGARKRRIEDARMADTALTAMRLPTTEFAIPSMDRHANGAPRFVLPIPVEAAGQAEVLQLVQEELAGDGVSAPLRLFLGAMLEAGDAYVDADPGFGMALLSAASRDADIAVVTRAADHDHAAFLSRALACNGMVRSAVQTPANGMPVSLDALTSHPMVQASTRLIVHAGRASEMAAVWPAVERVLRDARVAAVVWTSDDAAADVSVRDRASAIGAGHFVLAQDADGAVLVPFDRLPDAPLVVTLPARMLQGKIAA